MSFKDIHGPVPHYQERIAKGVDRFVTRMKAGDNWQLFNVTTSPFLYFCTQAIATVLTLPTLYSGVSRSMEKTYSVGRKQFLSRKGHTMPDETEAIDIDQCWLRYARQTLKVLPKTKAIVFGVRLYMTSLRDIVKEGNGVELADAIDSMPIKLVTTRSDHSGRKTFRNSSVKNSDL
ncbi:uncharacterized protein BP5553_06078 [Venustampulla echinocandica]|uniref:Uncharacterized protein n=1 Tax=Venustampulla echinocandica TaxID=2656787 RepID=A0A370TMH0_9HELO|nr:uncharacterized protein BP5553_06078 [Venustampulla echinocandica]RDL36726.1 hypothetical protein BP5553_06078 [Venustampulla echinocandica]